jgi:hypothetical protein
MRAPEGVIYHSRPPSGIAETPIKSRRIELWGFQETSEESFKERLMASGYGGYSSTSPEHATIHRACSNGQPLSPQGPSSTIAQEDGLPDGPTDEREARKRRRLEAFRREPTTRVKTSLHPVQVEGEGRVLLDVGTGSIGLARRVIILYGGEAAWRKETATGWIGVARW